MSNEVKAERVEELRKQGTPLKEALAQVKVNPGTYQYYRKKITAKPKKRRKRSALKVLDVPTAPISVGKLFLICGDAQSLAEFARNYQ